METHLHRQLKALYSAGEDRQEVRVEGYRIDAVVGDRLIEIQNGSLGAIRSKVRALLLGHEVLVVKPLAARKLLVKRNRRGGRVVSSRYSPSRQSYVDLFDDLVHFVDVFPHRRLVLEAVLTEQEEHRRPARRRRWFGRDYRVEERRLRAVLGRLSLRTAADLNRMLPDGLPAAFTTAEIAQRAEIPRWLAQKMAYCLRKCGAVEDAGKRGNARLYRIPGGEVNRAAA